MILLIAKFCALLYLPLMWDFIKARKHTEELYPDRFLLVKKIIMEMGLDGL